MNFKPSLGGETYSSSWFILALNNEIEVALVAAGSLFDR